MNLRELLLQVRETCDRAADRIEELECEVESLRAFKRDVARLEGLLTKETK